MSEVKIGFKRPRSELTMAEELQLQKLEPVEDTDEHGNNYGYYRITRKPKVGDPEVTKQIVYTSGLNFDEIEGKQQFRERNITEDLQRCFKTAGLDKSKETAILILARSSKPEQEGFFESVKVPFFETPVAVRSLRSKPSFPHKTTLENVDIVATYNNDEFYEFKNQNGVILAIFDYSSPPFEIVDDVMKTTYNFLAPGGSIYVEYLRPLKKYQLGRRGGIDKETLNSLIQNHSEHFDIKQIEAWPLHHAVRDDRPENNKNYKVKSSFDQPQASKNSVLGITLNPWSHYFDDEGTLWVHEGSPDWPKLMSKGILSRYSEPPDAANFYKTTFSLGGGTADGSGGVVGRDFRAGFLDLCLQ